MTRFEFALFMYKIRVKHFINAKSHCYKFHINHRHLHLVPHIQGYSWIQPTMKIFGENLLESFKNKNLNFLHASSCLPNISIVLGFYLFIFYWSIFDLQLCVTFRYRAKRFSYIWVHIYIIFQILFHYKLLTLLPCAIK